MNSQTLDAAALTSGKTVRRRRLFPSIPAGIAVAIILAAVGFVAWASNPARPTDRALSALASDATITVESSRWLVFRPTDVEPTVGLIVYPGALIDPRVYAPIAREVASKGYLVAIVPMPLNLAIFAPDSAFDVIAAYPSMAHWAVAGHSLGGAMAARFVHAHDGAAAGLVLWAAYPADTDRIAGQSVDVTSVYGTNYGLATRAKVDATRPLLPPRTTIWAAVPGGNHAQFGSYGPQSGDNPASIGEADQQFRVAAATVILLSRIAR